jgi:hypothetical protein
MRQVESSSARATLRLRKSLSGLKARYRALKGVAYYLYKAVRVDLRPMLRDVYRSIVACKRTLDARG